MKKLEVLHEREKKSLVSKFILSIINYNLVFVFLVLIFMCLNFEGIEDDEENNENGQNDKDEDDDSWLDLPPHLMPKESRFGTIGDISGDGGNTNE